MTLFYSIIVFLFFCAVNNMVELYKRNKIKKMNPLQRYEYHRKKLKNKEIQRLRNMSYPEYLTSAHWRMLRDAALYRDKKKCRDCGIRDHLQVHHLTYTRRGFENIKDVIVLCDDCHQMRHYL